jgi:hypothetical protein
MRLNEEGLDRLGFNESHRTAATLKQTLAPVRDQPPHSLAPAVDAGSKLRFFLHAESGFPSGYSHAGIDPPLRIGCPRISLTVLRRE